MKRMMAVTVALGLAVGCDVGTDHSGHKHDVAPAAPADANVKHYPLKTCVVSGEELGKMGKPARLVHEGQEILLCCSGCEKDFRKDAATFMKRIAESPKK